MKAVLDNMALQVAKTDHPAEKLEIFASTHLGLIEMNKDMAEIIQVELRQSGKFMKEYKNERFQQYLDIIEDIITEGQKEGFSGKM
jgi:TetR/AcrR family fatty acid metabolism transcriptional regulator